MKHLNFLSSPYRLKDLLLPNRVVMAPMTRSFSPRGVPTEKVAAYYRRRAEGGVGLIITESTGVGRPASVNEPDIPRFAGEAELAGWKKVVDEVHAAGGRIMPQLWHAGQKPSNFAKDWRPPSPYESPSGLDLTGRKVGEPMSEADITDTIEAFAHAAANAETLGFDGIEVHGAHGYLINQFFFDNLNLRNDKYGGKTLIERSRFAIDILKAIRRVVSPQFPVIFRLSQWKPHDLNVRIAETPAELEKFLNVLKDAGADAFHLSQQKFSDPAYPEIDPDLNFAGWAKKLTGATSITVGSVGLSGDVYSTFAGKTFHPVPVDPVVERLERGEFDLVAVGRPLLQDAMWLQKILQGRTNEISDFAPSALSSLN